MSESSNENVQGLTMLINTRYARISIHRQTLKALGDPAFINWGYHFQSKKLILFSSGTDACKALRVTLNKDGACYIYSRNLIDGLRHVSSVLTEDGSFLLKGEMDQKASSVSFKLEEAQIVMQYDEPR